MRMHVGFYMIRDCIIDSCSTGGFRLTVPDRLVHKEPGS